MSWKYFSNDELKCHCNKCGSNGEEMDTQMMQMLVILRKELDFPFPVTSAYRCPDHNSRVSSSGRKGRHTTGKAVDIAVSRSQALDLMSAAIKIGFTGVGVNQKGGGRFIHLDTCNAADGFSSRTVWSY